MILKRVEDILKCLGVVWSAVFMLAGCKDNIVLTKISPETYTLLAFIEDGTRTDFAWRSQAGDSIAVYDEASRTFRTWYQTGLANDVALFETVSRKSEWSKYAVYPATVSPVCDESGELTVSLPDEYMSDEICPLLTADFDDADDNLNLCYAGGVMRLRISNVPDSVSYLSLDAVNRRISGDFTLQRNEDGIGYIETSEGDDDCRVKVNLSPGAVVGGRLSVDLPLPVGLYRQFEVSLYDNHDKCVYCSKQLSNKLIRRAVKYTTAEDAIVGGLASMSVLGADSINVNDKAGTITIRMSYGEDLEGLDVTFSKFDEATVVKVNGVEERYSQTNIDFYEPVIIEVDDKKYVVTVAYSDLPIVYLTTPNHAAVTSKVDYVKKSTFVIGNTEKGKYDLTVSGAMNIKGRGNTTWGYPKKPYAIKFDKKQSILGMPKDKSWVLLANWADRTLIRNAVSFEVARRAKHLKWTPRGQFVDVVLNGEFLGNYYLCEKIKVSSDRVDITEIDNTERVVTEGDDLTGGYLLEFDSYYDEVYKFRTSHKDLPVNLKSPDEDVPNEQIDYIKGYIDNIESILYSADFAQNTRGYEQLIDVDSYVDWWIVNELVGNNEPNGPKSSYMHKDRLGKLVAGPVWDFDWGTFRPFGSVFLLDKAIWYDALFSDPVFVAKVKARWNELKGDFETIPDYIDSIVAQIQPSAEYNVTLWPITVMISGDEKMSYDKAVERLKANYLSRLGRLDVMINAL